MLPYTQEQETAFILQSSYLTPRFISLRSSWTDVTKCLQIRSVLLSYSSLGYIYAFITCGATALYTLYDTDRCLQDIGCALSYAESFRFPDAYLPLKKKAVTEKETETIVGKTLEKIRKAIEDTENETIKLPKKIPGWRIMRRFGSTLKPRANEKLKVSARCTGCGICASICPNGNIWIENGKANMDNRCITCFACYHRCPENAIEYPGATGQYKGLVDTKELRRK